MLKKLFLASFIIVSALGACYFYYLSEKRILITPYPYKMQDFKLADSGAAEGADILIIGDRMGKALDKQMETLKNSTQMKIYNWSTPHEGLHRSIHKLNSLNKFPSIIIYHGASEELFERKFSVSDKRSLEKNFQVFYNEKFISLIITFPWVSKLLYQKMNYFDLYPTIKENKQNFSPEEKLSIKQMSFMLFEQEIKDLIELVRLKKSKLIFITTPLNHNIPPRETCAHASTQGTIEMQTDINHRINLGQFKEAFSLVKQLSEVTKSNAQSFYLMGLAARGIGDLKLARNAFSKASAFDCANWRGNAVYNTIMINEANKRQIPVIDFDLQVNFNDNPEATFFDDLYPQNIFYQSLAKDLDETIKNISKSFK